MNHRSWGTLAVVLILAGLAMLLCKLPWMTAADVAASLSRVDPGITGGHPRALAAPQSVGGEEGSRQEVVTELIVLVVNRQNQPIQDAALVAGGPPAAETVLARSGDDGGIRIALADLGCLPKRVVHADYVGAALPALSADSTRVMLVLEDACSLDLTAREGTAAVPGVRVTCTQVDPSSGRPVSRHGDTGADGRLNLRGLLPGAYQLTCESETHVVVDYRMGGTLPATGEVVMAVPHVAYATTKHSLDSFQLQLSQDALREGLAPHGMLQSELARVAGALRRRSPNSLAMAVLVAEGTEAKGCVEVSGLAGGRWFEARIPFRRLMPGVTTDSNRLAHPVMFDGVAQTIHLPPGRYRVGSRNPMLSTAIGDPEFEVGPDATPQDPVDVRVRLKQHLAAARLRLNADVAGVGIVGARQPWWTRSVSVWVKNAAGGGMRLFGVDLEEDDVWLGGGSNEVVVQGDDGRQMHLHVVIDVSGKVRVDGSGQVSRR